MLVSPQQMLDAEAAWTTSDDGAGSLMTKAGMGIARAIREFFPIGPPAGTMVLALGPGNNAGDACVAAQTFAHAGWKVLWFAAIPDRPLSDLTRQNLSRIDGDISELPTPPDAPSADWPRPLIVVDGLLGIGARAPLVGQIAEAATKINHWRAHHNAFVVAIDIPTGVDGSSGVPDDHAVVADLTATICHPKTGLVADCAGNHVGRVALIPLKELTPSGDTSTQVTSRAMLAPWLPRPTHDSHKRTAGRVLIIAGSRGMTGAAALAASAALRSGAGLVTLFTGADARNDVARQSPPEVMVRTLPTLSEIDWSAFDSIGIGPGLGTGHDRFIHDLLSQCPLPVVVDADALNALSRLPTRRLAALLDTPPGPRILTPHPGEFSRIARDAVTRDRQECARGFVARHPGAVLLLKGHRTLIASHDGPLLVNPTGHAGMATPGTGDTLTGICATLAAKGLPPATAAACAAWVHGRAAEIASFHTSPVPAVDSLTASDVIARIGPAIHDLRNV